MLYFDFTTIYRLKQVPSLPVKKTARPNFWSGCFEFLFINKIFYIFDLGVYRFGAG